MTNLELIREVRKPGKVYMTVQTKHDVARIPVEKAFLLDLLRDQPANDEAYWDVHGDLGDGIFLDING